MAFATVLGFPRIGVQRELKKVTEAYWKGEASRSDLLTAASELRRQRWTLQQQAGLDLIPSNDFSLYDHMLDTSVMVGAIPERFGWTGDSVDLDLYFEMARGTRHAAMEMTKWFDTNYHYIVPEFTRGQEFRLTSHKPVEEYKEAKALGIETRPVLVGPLTYLMLGKVKGDSFPVLELLPSLLAVYSQVLSELATAGCQWVQMDEPLLALDLEPAVLEAYETAYASLKSGCGVKLFLATYFGALEGNRDTVLRLPVDAVHIDLVRAPDEFEALMKRGFPKEKLLSVGIVDGRNIWKNHLERSLGILTTAARAVGKERLIISSSCSLLHSPWDLSAETSLDPEIREWLAFATQKLDELVTLRRAIDEGKAAVALELAGNTATMKRRLLSERIHHPAVKERLAALEAADYERRSSFAERKKAQQAKLQLPLFPTTTIGSFPQTAEVRRARSRFRRGNLSAEGYEAFLKEQVASCVRLQEELDIDVLVHGEFERTDMVEYFGEQLDGFTFTENGWVQSYGTRCVKPPIIYGDVSRPGPMTVEWSAYAKSLTNRPMKGMLTGPVTILQWSFVRDDQPREWTCRQIGLAIRDEVLDLEAAGIDVIQIDEPALREGLPLRKAQREGYLRWAVESFRLAAAGVRDDTQIHTHMCYAEFNDIMPSIAALDADVISIETSRSDMELLQAFRDFAYENDIGPGVYDIHSPRVPETEDMVSLLGKAIEALSAQQLWVNPDCGLKTRGYDETVEALKRMVEAAKIARARYA